MLPITSLQSGLLMGLTSLNLGFIHYKCVVHIFDLGMKVAIKDLKDTVTPMRDAVMATRSSSNFPSETSIFGHDSERLQRMMSQQMS